MSNNGMPPIRGLDKASIDEFHDRVSNVKLSVEAEAFLAEKKANKLKKQRKERRNKCMKYFADNVFNFITLLIAIAALIVSLVR